MAIPNSNLEQLIGNTLLDAQGDKIGKIADIYLDDDTGTPEWIAVHTGLLGTKVHFVPIKNATMQSENVQVPFDAQMVKDAPNAEADGSLSPQEEETLYTYYGMDYSFGPSDSGLPEGEGRTAQAGTVGHDTSGPTTDDAMTRSEEQLHVGTRQTEAGRARLRKYVVTEQQTVTVPVSHEEVRLEREPITEANRDKAMSGPDISEEEHEVILHAETPVVGKETVPVERVRLDTETVVEQETVSADVRKEQIELDEDADNRR